MPLGEVGRKLPKLANLTIEKTHAWNDRKRMFEPAQIRVAWKILQRKGWLSRLEEGTRDARE